MLIKWIQVGSLLMDLYNIGEVIMESVNDFIEFNKMVEKFNLIVPVLSQQKPFTSSKTLSKYCKISSNYSYW